MPCIRPVAAVSPGMVPAVVGRWVVPVDVEVGRRPSIHPMMQVDEEADLNLPIVCRRVSPSAAVAVVDIRTIMAVRREAQVADASC